MDKQEVLLDIKNVQKSFGENPIHKDVCFQLHRGESIGLLGGSGTGKSTLLRSLIGLEYIDGGKIFYKGDRIDHLNENELAPYRLKISYSFQSGALFDSINVFENIAYPLFEHRKDLDQHEVSKIVKDYLSIIDMEGKEELMPSDLSGGMQKRVGMARSMVLGPDIILYDEPTAGLDPANTNNVIHIMEKLKRRGVASIFVTHDIPAALKICDKILILAEGKIAFSGTPREIVSTDDPLVKKFFTDVEKG